MLDLERIGAEVFNLTPRCTALGKYFLAPILHSYQIQDGGLNVHSHIQNTPALQASKHWPDGLVDMSADFSLVPYLTIL